MLEKLTQNFKDLVEIFGVFFDLVGRRGGWDIVKVMVVATAIFIELAYINLSVWLFVEYGGGADGAGGGAGAVVLIFLYILLFLPILISLFLVIGSPIMADENKPKELKAVKLWNIVTRVVLCVWLLPIALFVVAEILI